MLIIKRDGTKEEFNGQKIMDAILKAFEAVDGEISEYAETKAYNIAEYIESISDNGIELTIDQIQDLVQKGLMSTKRKDVAEAYIVYRHERDRIRTRKTSLRKEIERALKGNDLQNQNANVDEASFGGRKGEAAAALMKDIALNDIMSPMARKNHLENMIYTHDLDSYAVGMHNCLTIPFDDLLANGFNTRQTDVRPANSVNTAFQLVAVIFQLQSLQQFGGVSASHIDWTMVPYVRKSFYKHIKDGLMYMGKPSDYKVYNLHFKDIKENADISIENCDWSNYFTEEFCIPNEVYRYAIDMTKKEVYQAVEAMYHNLNTLQSRSGNQLPFTSINYGTCTLPEGRMVTKALLEVSIDGIGRLHRTSIFPCGIFQCMKGVNREPGDPNYDLFQLALKSTAKRLYPNYANVDWSGNAGYDINDPKTYFSTMGLVA